MKKAAIIVFLIGAVAWLIIANLCFPRYTGTINLKDGRDWQSVSWEISEGEAEKFSAALETPRTLKLVYDGKIDLRGTITLFDAAGETAGYDLRLYEYYDTVNESAQIGLEFIEIG